MASLSKSFTQLQARWPILRQIDVGLGIGIVVAVLCLGVFVSTAHDVVKNNTIVQIDQAIADELHQQGLQAPNLIAFYKVISAIGLPGVWVMGIAVGLLFLVRRQRLHLIVWSVTLIGGILVNNIVKLAFSRPRPVFPDPFVIEQNFSFPSGHAMIAIIGFGMLAYVILIPLKSRLLSIAIVFAIMLLIILVGISRMALGVHFFSDVIGGYAAGGAWLALCITIFDQLERRQLKQDAARAHQAAEDKNL
jgi:membrane-associated phospholipid phosphatase